jgi:hypothetical protein
VTGGDEVWWKKGEVAELGGGFASNEGLGLAAWQGRFRTCSGDFESGLKGGFSHVPPMIGFVGGMVQNQGWMWLRTITRRQSITRKPTRTQEGWW